MNLFQLCGDRVYLCMKLFCDMLKKEFPIFFLLSFLLIILISCGRYEDGPDFSIYKPEKRLINTWRFITYQDGSDNRTPAYLDSVIDFKDNNLVRICTEDFSGCREGRWDFLNDKNDLQLILGNEAITFEIRRLKSDEIWLENFDSVLIRWELRPQ